MLGFLNVSYRKVGGLHFVKFGRINFSWSVSKAYKPTVAQERAAALALLNRIQAENAAYMERNGAAIAA